MGITKINKISWTSIVRLNGVLTNNISLISGVTTSSTDPDAQAFITAAGITDSTQQSAINTLVVSLKSNGLWVKMDAIYPFIGGTASTHKWNLKDPRDLNEAFRLQFFGGVTHNSTGVTFNGTNAYSNTFFIPSIQIQSTEYTSLSLYSRTNSITSTIRVDMAVNQFNNNGVTGAFQLSSGYNSSVQLCFIQCDLPNAYTYSHFAAQGTNTNTTGFYCGRMDASTTAIYKNGNLIAANTGAKQSTRSSPNTSMFIGADRYNGNPRRYTNKNLAFAHIGKSMTDGDMSNLYTIVQAYQTTLNRAIT
jgi:hypothetical protein